MADRKYFGDWSEHSEVARDFVESGPTMATDDEILVAEYTYEDYSGSALVLYERGGRLYEVQGGHCSCYGLEDQWSPEETSWAAIAMRPHFGVTPEGRVRLTELVALKHSEG